MSFDDTTDPFGYEWLSAKDAMAGVKTINGVEYRMKPRSLGASTMATEVLKARQSGISRRLLEYFRRAAMQERMTWAWELSQCQRP